MIPLDITPNIELAPWTDCEGLEELAGVSKIGLLPSGTESGQPVVLIKMEMSNGDTFVGQTTWKLFRAASRALNAAIETHGMMDGVEDA